MKTLFNPKNLVLLLSLLMGCGSDDREKLDEKPDNIIPSKPCETLYRSIMDRFPEKRDNMEAQSQLFEPTALKEIVLTKESPVYVTFISEGAGYNNTFGYYTYDASNKPTSTSQITKNVVFPNASERVLTQGDMLQLGDKSFPAGTVIGFFLVVDGWERGQVNYDRTTEYTDPSLNPNGHQQHILFKQNTCLDIVLAFEDVPLEEDSDRDFNDIIFTVADNPDQKETVSFNLDDIVGM